MMHGVCQDVTTFSSVYRWKGSPLWLVTIEKDQFIINQGILPIPYMTTHLQMVSSLKKNH